MSDSKLIRTNIFKFQVSLYLNGLHLIFIYLHAIVEYSSSENDMIDIK